MRKRSLSGGQEVQGRLFYLAVPVPVVFILFPLISDIRLSLTDHQGNYVGFDHTSKC